MARVTGYQDLRPRSLSRRFSPLSSTVTGRIAGRGMWYFPPLIYLGQRAPPRHKTGAASNLKDDAKGIRHT